MRRNTVFLMLAAVLLFSMTAIASQPGEIARTSADQPLHQMQPVDEIYNPARTGHALFIKDIVNYWTDTAYTDVLTATGITYDQVNSASLGTVTWANYDFVILAENQDETFNANVNAAMADIQAFVNNGGWFLASMATNANITPVQLWDGTTYATPVMYEQWNDYGPDGMGHYAFTGMTVPFQGNYANHGYLMGFPPGADILAQTDTSGDPTLIEYTAGSGRVIATTCVLTHMYAYFYTPPGGGMLIENLLMYFSNNVNPPPLVVNVTPNNTTVPPGGGNISYYASVTNNTATPKVRAAWIQVQHMPSGNSVETVYFPSLTFPAMNTIGTTLNQYIPGVAPAGQYMLTAYVGNHPWAPQASDHFMFTKTVAAADAAGSADMTVFSRPDEWIATGSFGDEDVVGEALPSQFELGKAYPNPFNPSTTMNVSLPEAAELSVVVYNVAGQQVRTIASGNFSAGSHTLTFDAANLAGGVYFVHASATGWNAVQKVVLMK